MCLTSEILPNKVMLRAANSKVTKKLEACDAYIRNVPNRNDELKYLSVRKVMEQMETLSEIKYTGKCRGMLTETSPLQRQILEAFEVALPT